MIFHDYEFKSEYYQNAWRCILSNTFENMELYFRKQFSMQRLLSYYRKAFGIAPITLKNSTDDKYYKHKLLAIYLLTKYSKEKFEVIASEFNTSLQTINLISANSVYATTYRDDIRLFFKEIGEDNLSNRKTSLALADIGISRQSNVEEDILC